MIFETLCVFAQISERKKRNLETAKIARKYLWIPSNDDRLFPFLVREKLFYHLLLHRIFAEVPLRQLRLGVRDESVARRCKRDLVFF